MFWGSPGLTCRPSGPLVTLDRISPEEFFGRSPPQAQEIFPDNHESHGNRQPLIAVGPVTPEEHAVGSKNRQNAVEPRSVKFEIGRDPAVHPAQYFRHLHEN